MTAAAPADVRSPAVPVRRAAASWRGRGGDGRASLAPPAPARAPAADHEMPFPCDQEWYGSTRVQPLAELATPSTGTRPDDLGKPVVAAGAGVVTRVENLGSRSYGLYAILDHGDGESTLYAHLAAEYVTVGQRVDQGELIGRVGESGGRHRPPPALRAAATTAATSSRGSTTRPSCGQHLADLAQLRRHPGRGRLGRGRRRRGRASSGARRTGAFVLDAGGSVRTAQAGAGPRPAGRRRLGR